MLSRFIIANTLALFSIFGGWIPEFRWQPTTLVLQQFAYSQEYSADKINRYAEAILSIETQRKKAFDAIQKTIGRVPSQLNCTSRESIKKLPRDAQAIAVEFCNRSKQIARDSGLTATEFNQITAQAQQDSALKEQIQRAIIRLRQ